MENVQKVTKCVILLLRLDSDSMRKKNGYTFIDILIIIVGLGLATLFTVPKISRAFESDKDELYSETLELYLKQATKYGDTIKEEIKNSDSYVVSIKDLVDKGYVGSVNGEVTDIRDGSSMLNLKIHLIYNDNSDSVYAELV